MFKYSGQIFDDYACSQLDVKHMEGFVDSADSYVNVVIYTHDRHRPSELKNIISAFNGDFHSRPMQQIIIRQQSQFEDEIMTLSGKKNPQRHPFYLRILEARDNGNATYFISGSSHGRGEKRKEFSKQRRLEYELGIDMVPSALEAHKPRRSNGRSSIDSDTLSNAKSGVEHSDPVFQVSFQHVPGRDDSNNIGQSEISRIDPQHEESLSIPSDNAVYSPMSPPGDSISDPDYLAGFSPRTRALGRTLSHVMRKEFRAENASRTYLVEKVQAQEIAIKDHVHKRNVQEGKTAHQTRMANAAIRSEAIAKESLDAAVSQLDIEHTLRENVQAEAGSLLLSNVNMSASLRDLSAGARVWVCLRM
jgi:hypothetical protein